jgi:hypothetical protein
MNVLDTDNFTVFPLIIKREAVYRIAYMATGVKPEDMTFEWAWKVFLHVLKAYCINHNFRYKQYRTLWKFVKPEPLPPVEGLIVK